MPINGILVKIPSTQFTTRFPNTLRAKKPTIINMIDTTNNPMKEVNKSKPIKLPSAKFFRDSI